MQVRAGDVGEIDLPYHADARAGRTLARSGEVLEVEDRHVAAVAVAFEIAAGRGAGPQRRDHLEEAVADREHGVLKAELGDAGVAKRLSERERRAQRARDRLELGRHEHRLAQPHAWLGLRHALRAYRRVGRPGTRRAGAPPWQAAGAGRVGSRSGADLPPRARAPAKAAVNAREEARVRVADRYDARVLEPSPPTVNAGPWFADDPVGRELARGALPVLGPVAGGDLRWQELCEEDATLAPWCAERWLAAYPQLQPPPASLPGTRAALQALAEGVMAPAREHANGKIGLRYTRGGFGTPFFGEDVQLRVAGGQLIVQRGQQERSAQIETLAQCAAHVGAELLPSAPAADSPLAVDPAASRFLGEWFGFGVSVLEELRAGAGDALEPSRVQLWPEHFDLSVELGGEQGGARAGYGASPGDELHEQPYLYVVPWGELPDGALWQASAFAGAELPYASLLAAGSSGAEQRELALAFFGERLAALVG